VAERAAQARRRANRKDHKHTLALLESGSCSWSRVPMKHRKEHLQPACWSARTHRG